MISDIWYVGSAVVCCNQNDILDSRSSTVLQSKVIICKFPSSSRQIFRKLFDLHHGWNFSGYKFLTIAVSFIMDIERGIQCLQIAFLLKGHRQMVEIIIRLLELKDHIAFSTERKAFCGVGKVAQISVYVYFVKNSFSQSLAFPGKRKINLNH